MAVMQLLQCSRYYSRATPCPVHDTRVRKLSQDCAIGARLIIAMPSFCCTVYNLAFFCRFLRRFSDSCVSPSYFFPKLVNIRNLRWLVSH